MSDAPLDILLTDPHLRGGGQVRYVISLSKALLERGHRVSIGCRPESVLADLGREVGANIFNELLLRGGLRPRAWWQDIQRIRQFTAVRQPDILHVNGSQDHWSCAVANRLSGFSSCLVRTRHNTYNVANHGPNRILNQRWTDFQIVVCEEVRRDLARQAAFDERRMVSIHNGVDPTLFAPNEAARIEARSEFGYGPEDIVCGIAARLVPAKGHVFLFKAVAQLAPSYPHLKVLVLGQGGLEQELKKLAMDLGIAERIQFAGFRDDMAFCTRAFDIGALPSIDCDTSSFSLKEEMACGLPVVASDYGGLKEILHDGVEGFVAPTGTVAPLASALRRLLDDADLRRRMGEMGRKRVLRDFSLDVFADRTVLAYRQAIATYKKRRGHAL